MFFVESSSTDVLIDSHRLFTGPEKSLRSLLKILGCLKVLAKGCSFHDLHDNIEGWNPDDVDIENVSSTHENGLLTINLPRKSVQPKEEQRNGRSQSEVEMEKTKSEIADLVPF